MSRPNQVHLRASQRVPRSCISCSSRRVKCDKKVPCSTCIRRGKQATCSREAVLVRGQVEVYVPGGSSQGKPADLAYNPASAQDGPDSPSYRDLLGQNERLHQELHTCMEQTNHDDDAEPRPGRARIMKSHDYFEDLLRRVPLPDHVPSESTVTCWNDISFPSRSVSQALLEYDRIWNSWVHQAMEYASFGAEHGMVLAKLEQGAQLHEIEPSWLALYYSVITAALLMMTDDDLEILDLSSDTQELNRKWYDASLFCLQQSDYMRRPKLHTVQTIAVLGMCFPSFGDWELGEHLWSSAIRVAQKIGLDTMYTQGAAPMDAESQHRLWWTLVICDWLSGPFSSQRVEEGSFDVPFPAPRRDDPLRTVPAKHPVHYHTFMARTSLVFYRFCSLYRSGRGNLSEVVRRADRELADVITTLPRFLQPDAEDDEKLSRLETEQQWIKWQRFDITVVLLHHRMRVHCVLQDRWKHSPDEYGWARSVSIKSAMDIIWINHNWDQPSSMRKQWALSLHIAAAAMLLFDESNTAEGTQEHVFHHEITIARALLDEVRSQNVLARQAAMALEYLLSDLQARPGQTLPHPT